MYVQTQPIHKNYQERTEVAYPGTHPARAYIDHTASYASNEVCINWNAPLVLILAYLNHQ
jgi:endoglucanase